MIKYEYLHMLSVLNTCPFNLIEIKRATHSGRNHDSYINDYTLQNNKTMYQNTFLKLYR